MILLPSLDTRTWDQLTDEARRELPRLAPHWTDYNASDPGITALELLAWIAETTLYRSDRTPDSLQRSFLRLLGFPPDEATPAATVLTVTGGPAALPAGVQIATADGVLFETVEPLAVSKAALVALLVDVGDGTAPYAPDQAPWLALGPAPRAGSALHLGFDSPLGAEGTSVRLFLWAEGFPADLAVPSAIEAERQAWAADCARPRGAPPAPPLPPWRQHYSARVIWEYRTVAGWEALANVADDTRALSISGAVAFDAPPIAGAEAHIPDPVDGRFFLRCRLVEGSYDRAPRLLALAPNAVAARHAAARPEARLGRAAGSAFETFWLPEAPIVPGSLRLRLRLNGVDDLSWMAHADLDVSGPFDTHLALDPEAANLKGGDGRQGAPLPAGAEVFATYALGGGPTGNLPARSLDRIALNDTNAALLVDPMVVGAAIAISQPVAATGGAAGEGIADARARAIVALETPDKAVTLDDFERHAKATPGVPLARAAAVARLHPLMPTVDAAGCVAVILLPDAPGPAPEPSAALRAAVARYLERRRLVGTELHVLGPTYRDLSVAATLNLTRGTDPAAARAEAERRLNARFHPLSGGPDGRGWPPGAAVNAADLLALLEAVPGIDGVTDMTLHAGNPPRGFCDGVALCPGELIRVAPHAISVVVPDGAAPARDPDHGCC